MSRSKHRFTAAVLEQQNAPLALRTLELPEHLSVGQVIVKVAYSGICGAQLGEIAGVKGPDKYLPHCLGHEGSGEIIATGPGVRHVKPGNKVVLHWRKGVGIESEPPQYRCPELNREIGGGCVTTFQEYSVVSENRLTRVPDDIPMDEAALFGCAVTTGLGAVCHEMQVCIGQSVVVFGCGGVGLNVIQGCSLVSAYPIIGVDIVESKLKQARLFGATHTFGSGDAVDCISRLVGDRGADYVVDTTGNASMMNTAWKLCAPTGKVCLIAQLRYDQNVTLNTLPMHTGKRLIASDGGGTNPSEDIPRYVRLLESGRLKLRPLITHTRSLSEINNLLDDVRTGRVGRAIIRM